MDTKYTQFINSEILISSNQIEDGMANLTIASPSQIQDFSLNMGENQPGTDPDEADKARFCEQIESALDKHPDLLQLLGVDLDSTLRLHSPRTMGTTLENEPLDFSGHKAQLWERIFDDVVRLHGDEISDLRQLLDHGMVTPETWVEAIRFVADHEHGGKLPTSLELASSGWSWLSYFMEGWPEAFV